MAPIPRQMQVSTRSRRPARSGNQARTTFSRPALSRVERNPGPVFLKTDPGKTRIKHREFVDTVTSGASAVFTSYLINPGNATLFPWLSQLAGAWEKFNFNKLHFEYVPTCATTSEGEFGTFVDYDCKDVDATLYSEFMNSAGAVSAAFYQSTTNPLDTRSVREQRNSFYTARVTQTTEKLNYYPGKLQTYTSVGTVAAKGRLFVSYDVTLDTPQGLTNDYAYYLDLNSSVLISATNNLIQKYFALSGGTNGQFGTAWKVVNGYLVCQVPGTYLITLNFNSADTNSTTVTPMGTAVSNEYHEVINATAALTVQRVVANYGDTVDWQLSADVTVTTIDIRVGKYFVF